MTERTKTKNNKLFMYIFCLQKVIAAVHKKKKKKKNELHYLFHYCYRQSTCYNVQFPDDIYVLPVSFIPLLNNILFTIKCSFITYIMFE
jgi:hypothetical protein